MVPAETCERLPTGGEVVTEVLERMRFWFLDETERQYQERCLMVTQEAFEKERLHWEAEHARVGEYTKRERRLLLEAFSRNRRKAAAPPPKPKQWKFKPRAPPCFSTPERHPRHARLRVAPREAAEIKAFGKSLARAQ